MAATNFTPISLYYSTTALAVPTAGNLVNGELALNTADMKLYAKNSSGVVTLLASSATAVGVESISFGSTGLTPSTATSGAVTVAGTLAVANGGTGVTTSTGTGSTVLSASPTFTGTISAAAITASGAVTGNGNWVMGNADTDTITQSASYVTGTTLKSAKLATNTLALAAYDVDGAVYTSLVTLTASNTPTLALTSTGVGTINNMSVGATTPSTGAFTTLTASTPIGVASGGTGASTLAGANIPVVNVANTFTATQTFSGSATTLAVILENAAELTTVSATAATGTIAYDVLTQSVLYYTTNASANWTLNVRGSSGTSLNTVMSVGQTVTVTFMVTNGGTAYYASAFQIDGTSVTPKWQGGTAPTSGNASSIDVYTYAIVKTASATYTVFASQTKFA